MPTVEGRARARRAPTPGPIVLEAKLTPPRVRAEHVLRRGLLAALSDGDPRTMTLIAAPPGFGKTTLLAEWAAAEDTPPVAWLSLDGDDNDPARFAAYVIAALRSVSPEVGAKALAALQAPGASLTESVLPHVLNDLATFQSGIVVALDDYYLITNPDIHEALSYLVEHAPSGVRLVLATREDPPLPLGRMRARGELVEIRAADLRFSDDETASFLNGGLGLELTAEDLDRLHARTEGWPAALYLAALSLRDGGDASRAIGQFAGDDRYLVDYLTAELVARQPPELRSFLLRTSVLGRFCASLCDAVTEGGGSAELLAELERSNLLLVPLDKKREWYRYHHLFADLLRHELAASDPDAVTTLHRRAYAWYRDAGLIVDAAGHAKAAGDLHAAVELVGRHYAFFVDQGQLATVMHWIATLPEATAAEDWLICFAAGVVTAHSGLLDEAEHWLALAEAAPQVVRDGQEPTGPVAALAAYTRLLRGDIAGTIANGRRALGAAPAAEPLWALAPQMVLAPALWWSPARDEAKAILEAATRTAQAAGIPATAMYALGIRAAIALDDQDEQAAETLAHAAIEIMREGDFDEHPWAATPWIVHGRVLARHGELPAAADAIERGIAFGERQRAWQVTAYGSLALAEVRQRQHEPAAARRLLTRVREILIALPDPGDGLSRLEQTEKLLNLRAARDRSAPSAPFWELSQRELAVLRLLPSQLSQREIAAELFISFNTVKTHTRAIFAKLGASSRAEAVERARELGLL